MSLHLIYERSTSKCLIHRTGGCSSLCLLLGQLAIQVLDCFLPIVLWQNRCNGPKRVESLQNHANELQMHQIKHNKLNYFSSNTSNHRLLPNLLEQYLKAFCFTLQQSCKLFQLGTKCLTTGTTWIDMSTKTGDFSPGAGHSLAPPGHEALEVQMSLKPPAEFQAKSDESLKQKCLLLQTGSLLFQLVFQGLLHFLAFIHSLL